MNTVTIGDFDRYMTAMIVTLSHFTELLDKGLLVGPARLSDAAMQQVKEAYANGFEFNPGEFEELIHEIFTADWDGVFDDSECTHPSTPSQPRQH